MMYFNRLLRYNISFPLELSYRRMCIGCRSTRVYLEVVAPTWQSRNIYGPAGAMIPGIPIQLIGHDTLREQFRLVELS